MLVKSGQVIETDRTLAAVAVTQIFLSVHCDKRTSFWLTVSFCSRAPRSRSIQSFQMQSDFLRSRCALCSFTAKCLQTAQTMALP